MGKPIKNDHGKKKTHSVGNKFNKKTTEPLKEKVFKQKKKTLPSESSNQKKSRVESSKTEPSIDKSKEKLALPIKNWDQSGVMVQISEPSKAARILYSNPVCFLTTKDSTGIDNVMTISWLAPANNYGGFVFVIHKKRHSTSNLLTSKKFILSVATEAQIPLLLAVGKISGRTVNKFGRIPELTLTEPGNGCEIVTSTSFSEMNEFEPSQYFPSKKQPKKKRKSNKKKNKNSSQGQEDNSTEDNFEEYLAKERSGEFKMITTFTSPEVAASIQSNSKLSKVSSSSPSSSLNMYSMLNDEDDEEDEEEEEDNESQIKKKNENQEEEASDDEEGEGDKRKNRSSPAVSSASSSSVSSFPKAIPLSAAHLVCRLVSHSPGADPGHWVCVAQIEQAFVNPKYWITPSTSSSTTTSSSSTSSSMIDTSSKNEKCFAVKISTSSPSSSSSSSASSSFSDASSSLELPSLVTFLGSQKFGRMFSIENE